MSADGRALAISGARLALRRGLAVAVGLAFLGAVIVATLVAAAAMQARSLLQPAFRARVLPTYTPKTGDIVMMHYLGHGLIGIPVAEHWPTHAGMVWVRPRGDVVVLECTKFSAPALPNVLAATKGKERGVRAVPWGEFVNSVDNVLYIREVAEGAIPTEAVETAVNEWAVNLDFETRIADSMTLDVTIAIGFAAVWPNFTEWCHRAARLDDVDRRKGQAFCSEFVSQMLQRVGATDPEFRQHYRVSPASFFKSLGILDKLAAKGSLGVRWGEDRMLVRRA